MTKRRADSSLLHETPHPQKKKKWRSVCDAEPELHVSAASPPGLFSTLIGERRRKRPRCCEDHEEHGKAGPPGRTLTNTPDDEERESGDGCVSGKFRRASDACTCEMTSKESTSGSKPEERLKVKSLHKVI